MKLLQPYTLGSLKLKNRMVMAAMTRSRADTDGIVGDLTAEYYVQRASAGLILSAYRTKKVLKNPVSLMQQGFKRGQNL